MARREIHVYTIIISRAWGPVLRRKRVIKGERRPGKGVRGQLWGGL